MRYAVISKGLPLERLETEAKKVGARDVKKARLTKQLFCELSEAQARQLSQAPGLAVKPVKEIRPAQIIAPEFEAQQEVIEVPPVGPFDLFAEMRSVFMPPLSGVGLTVAVLDSGIRKTHDALVNKVVYEANLTDSPGAGDVFGHGTQVAFVVAGRDAQGKAGVSPGAKLMNIKVLDDEGTSPLA